MAKSLLKAAEIGDFVTAAARIEKRNIFGKKSIDLDVPYDGYTALHKTCINGHTDIARLLLQSNARHDILVSNRYDSSGLFEYNALMLAVKFSHPDLVQILINAGANPNTVPPELYNNATVRIKRILRAEPSNVKKKDAQNKLWGWGTGSPRVQIKNGLRAKLLSVAPTGGASAVIGSKVLSVGQTSFSIYFEKMAHYMFVGLARPDIRLDASLYTAVNRSSLWLYCTDGTIQHNDQSKKFFKARAKDTVQVVVDFDESVIAFSKNHKDPIVAFNLVTPPLVAVLGISGAGDSVILDTDVSKFDVRGGTASSKLAQIHHEAAGGTGYNPMVFRDTYKPIVSRYEKKVREILDRDEDSDSGSDGAVGSHLAYNRAGGDRLNWRFTRKSVRLQIYNHGLSVACVDTVENGAAAAIGGSGMLFGVHRWYITVEKVRSYCFIGVARKDINLHSTIYSKENRPLVWLLCSDGTAQHNNSNTKGLKYRAGDTISVLLDMDTGNLSFGRNDVTPVLCFHGIELEVFPVVGLLDRDDEITLTLEDEAYKEPVGGKIPEGRLAEKSLDRDGILKRAGKKMGVMHSTATSRGGSSQSYTESYTSVSGSNSIYSGHSSDEAEIDLAGGSVSSYTSGTHRSQDFDEQSFLSDTYYTPSETADGHSRSTSTAFDSQSRTSSGIGSTNRYTSRASSEWGFGGSFFGGNSGTTAYSGTESSMISYDDEPHETDEAEERQARKARDGILKASEWVQNTVYNQEHDEALIKLATAQNEAAVYQARVEKSRQKKFIKAESQRAQEDAQAAAILAKAAVHRAEAVAAGAIEAAKSHVADNIAEKRWQQHTAKQAVLGVPVDPTEKFLRSSLTSAVDQWSDDSYGDTTTASTPYTGSSQYDFHLDWQRGHDVSTTSSRAKHTPHSTASGDGSGHSPHSDASYGDRSAVSGGSSVETHVTGATQPPQPSSSSADSVAAFTGGGKTIDDLMGSLLEGSLMRAPAAAGGVGVSGTGQSRVAWADQKGDRTRDRVRPPPPPKPTGAARPTSPTQQRPSRARVTRPRAPSPPRASHSSSAGLVGRALPSEHDAESDDMYGVNWRSKGRVRGGSGGASGSSAYADEAEEEEGVMVLIEDSDDEYGVEEEGVLASIGEDREAIPGGGVRSPSNSDEDYGDSGGLLMRSEHPVASIGEGRLPAAVSATLPRVQQQQQQQQQQPQGQRQKQHQHQPPPAHADASSSSSSSAVVQSLVPYDARGVGAVALQAGQQAGGPMVAGMAALIGALVAAGKELDGSTVVSAGPEVAGQGAIAPDETSEIFRSMRPTFGPSLSIFNTMDSSKDTSIASVAPSSVALTLEDKISRIKDTAHHIAKEELEGPAVFVGKGSFGKVYRMKWQRKFVAVKVFETIGSSDEAAMQDFSREVSMLSSLSHSHITRFYGSCVSFPATSDPYVAIIMEYVDGGSLHNLLYNVLEGPMAPAVVFRLAYDTAIALEHLHTRQPPVAHRDVKPANLLLFTDGAVGLRVKLTDFGLSRTITPDAVYANAGTAAYMAPELLRGQCAVTTKMDVYSYGIVLWEMLSRQRPWAGCTYEQVRTAVLFGDRPPMPSIPGIPPSFYELIEDTWHGLGSHRPTMTHVRQRLEAIMEGRLIQRQRKKPKGLLQRFASLLEVDEEEEDDEGANNDT